MNSIDLPCLESVSLINGMRCCPQKQDNLQVGYNLITYLYFELPPAVFFTPVKEARLILFKIPVNGMENPSASWHSLYAAYPLLDFFSVYSSWYMPPGVQEDLRTDYEDQPYRSYTEIDMTAIAAAWIEEKLENKGLLLMGAPYARQLVYASGEHEIPGMRPRIRLTFEGPAKPLSAEHCIVEINR